jgi:hypothetical protein
VSARLGPTAFGARRCLADDKTSCWPQVSVIVADIPLVASVFEALCQLFLILRGSNVYIDSNEFVWFVRSE